MQSNKFLSVVGKNWFCLTVKLSGCTRMWQKILKAKFEGIQKVVEGMNGNGLYLGF